MDDTIFKIGNMSITLIDVLVTVACVALLTIFLVCIIKDIKKKNKAQQSSDMDGCLDGSAEGNESASTKKKNMGVAFAVSQDKISELLGFDPYSAIDTSGCEIAEEYHDGTLETEDMRSLREKMRLLKQYEKKLDVLKERHAKIRYELEKTSRFIRDKRIVISSSIAMSEKLRNELATITVDKRTEKANKSNVERINNELQKATKTANDLTISVDSRITVERKLKDAQEYVASELSQVERDIDTTRTAVNRLNESVGIELKRIENENRARELMNSFHDLKPLLLDVNTLFLSINNIDAELADIHKKKQDIKRKIDENTQDLKLAYGAEETQKLSYNLSELNSTMVELDDKEDTLIENKESIIEKFRVAKRKANDFLDKEKYTVDDIIAAEDKVIGELEYNRVKSEYETKRADAQARNNFAQNKYDEIVSKKVKFKKNDIAKKQQREKELQSALDELKIARAEFEKASDEYDRMLPTLTPLSLVRSGSGVMSRERLNKSRGNVVEKNNASFESANKNISDNTNNAERPQAQQNVSDSSRYDSRGFNNEFSDYGRTAYRNTIDYDYPPTRRYSRPVNQNVPATQSSLGANQIARLMQRLNELERFALREKEQRAIARRELAMGVDIDGSQNKIERRKAQIIAMRKNFKYIVDERSAQEFKHRLYQISISLDAEEASDKVLNEMIRRTMLDATRLGERFSNKI